MSGWNHVVVHHSAGHDTAGLDTEGITRFHKSKGWRDVGYAFLVERVGDYYVAIAGRPLVWAGAHEPKANRSGIGVCFVGNFSVTDLPREQLEAGARLIAGLLVLIADVTVKPDVAALVKPHRHYKATECPGTRFPLEALHARVWELIRLAEV